MQTLGEIYENRQTIGSGYIYAEKPFTPNSLADVYTHASVGNQKAFHVEGTTLHYFDDILGLKLTNLPLEKYIARYME